jgi:hypothetical protein
MKWLQRIRAGIGKLLRWLWRYGWQYAIWAMVIVTLLPRSTPLLGERWYGIAYETSAWQFDYIGWELGALSAKTQQTLYGTHALMTETARTDLVRAYFADLAQVQQLEAQISDQYGDPAIDDPAAATVELRAERDARRADLKTRQLTIEAILEGQVAAVLVEQGFGTGGQLFPPMAMHFTEVPNLLVISPRDRIALDLSINLYAMPIDDIVALEDRLRTKYDVSALVVPLGGIALYPAMITETSSIPRAAEVFAHEWLHHALFFYPLGLSYFIGGDGLASEARIINETTADLFGKEVGRLVLQRYYPDLVPPLPTTDAPPATTPPQPPAFDFGAAMNTTRVTVDTLLAAGSIAEAEAYMEDRRQFFWEQGYRYRKLNQAFFAFYGGYQGGAVPGVGGEDPIGPNVQQIRAASATLADFVVTMRDITSRADLAAKAGELDAQ